MRMVLNAAGEEGYNSESTMIVCNRWEMVPEKDRDVVKSDTFLKLSKYFSDLKHSQMHCMSITKVSYCTFVKNYNKYYG